MFLLLALILTFIAMGLRIWASGLDVAEKAVSRSSRQNGNTNTKKVARMGMTSLASTSRTLAFIISRIRDAVFCVGSAIVVVDLIILVLVTVSASGFLLLFTSADEEGNMIFNSDKKEVVETTTGGATTGGGTTPATGDKVANDQTLGSITQLINKTHALPSDYVPSDLELVDLSNTWSGDMKLRAPALAELRKLFADASTAGHTLICVSGYRDYDLQTTLYNRAVANLGQEKADLESAQPGKSEHQSGLAMDVSCSSEGNDLQESFGDTPEGKWVAENAHKYGFIVRYASDKTAITGYGYEPWHIRYLGVEMATAVKNSGLCYEEYIGIMD